MKLLAWLLLICIACGGCRNDVSEPDPRIKTVLGKWKLSQIRIEDNGTMVWQEVPYHQENDIEIRPDAVILDFKGERVCCHPTSLVVNGTIIDIENLLKAPANTNCTIGCLTCQIWTLSVGENELTITGCTPLEVKKYTR